MISSFQAIEYRQQTKNKMSFCPRYGKSYCRPTFGLHGRTQLEEQRKGEPGGRHRCHQQTGCSWSGPQKSRKIWEVRRIGWKSLLWWMLRRLASSCFLFNVWMYFLVWFEILKIRFSSVKLQSEFRTWTLASPSWTYSASASTLRLGLTWGRWPEWRPGTLAQTWPRCSGKLPSMPSTGFWTRFAATKFLGFFLVLPHAPYLVRQSAALYAKFCNFF